MTHRSFAAVLHCAVVALATGCSGGSVPAKPGNHTIQSLARTSSFDLVGQSWVRVEGRIADGPPTRFMVDTGMGVTLVTPEACKRAGCVPTGKWTGKRMSGQAIEISLARVRSLEIAGHRLENAQVAVFELDAIMHRDLGIEGIAGLDVFRDQAVTFDHPTRRVILENASSLEQRTRAGVSVPVRVDNDGPSTVVFLPLELSAGQPPIEMEVDSGSRHMILDDRFMGQLGIDPQRPDVKKVTGKDETGQSYVRHYAPLPHRVHAKGAPSIAVESGTSVMFQKIIHDGLLGQEFLQKHVVTFDLPRGRMIFGPELPTRQSDARAPVRSWRDEVQRKCGALLDGLTAAAVDKREELLGRIAQACAGKGLVVAAERASSFHDRKLAFEHLRKLNDPGAADAIVDYLSEDPSPHWEAEAAFALAELGDLRAVRHLARHLFRDPTATYSESKDVEEQVLARSDSERVIAARLLSDLAVIHPHHLDDIRRQAAEAVRDWASSVPSPHANAMRFFAATRSKDDLPALRSWAFPATPLPSPGQQPPFPMEWVTAQSALRYLGAMRDEPSWSSLEKQLARRKTDARDIDVSSASLLNGGLAMTGMALRAIGAGSSDGLSEWGDARAFPLLLKFAEDRKNNEEARNRACRALAWVTPESRIGELEKRIKSAASARSKADLFSAMCLIGGVSYRPMPGLNGALIELIAPRTQEHLRVAAAVALGRSGMTEAEGRRVIARRAPGLQREVAMALVMGGDPASARASVAGFSASELEGLQAMIRDSIDFVSEEDLRGLLPRLARNARELGLRGLMGAVRYDTGPHSLTVVVLRYKLRQMGGEEAARVLQMMAEAEEP